MSKTIPANAATLLAEAQGTEPQIIIDCLWNDGSNAVLYGDLNNNDYETVLPKILDISGFDESFNTNNTTNVGVVTVTLSDNDATVMGNINTYNLFTTQFVVYLSYPTLVKADWVVLIKGKGTGPLTWDEHNRTVTFSIMPDQHYDIVGFSLQDDDEVSSVAINPIDTAVGQAYPICWGNPLRVPAIKIQEPFHATIEEDVLVDDTLQQTMKLSFEAGSAPAGEETYVIANTLCTGTIADDILTVPIGQMNETWYTNILFAARPGADPDALGARNVMWVVSADTELAGKYCYTGDNYQKCIHQEGTKCWFMNDWYGATGSQPTQFTEVKGIPDSTWTTYTTIFRSVSRLTSGATVYWVDDTATEAVYVCNLFPSDDVAEVMAFRTFGVKDEKKLAAVPSSRLTVDHAYPLPDRFITAHPSAPAVCSVIKIDKPLYQYEEEKWDDDIIYVSQYCHTDNLRRNPADIIEDLIEYYAPDLSVDATTFAAVKTLLANYLMSGWIAEELNLWELITEIAWQARCAVYERNDVVYLQYLSKKPTAPELIGLFREDHTLEQSMSLELSPETDIVTTMKGMWLLEGSQKKSFEVHDSRRIDIYGSRKSDYNFFMYNDKSLVAKTMEFWLERSSHVWKILKAQSTIYSNIQIDAGDYAKIRYFIVDPLDVGFGPVTGQVIGYSYDSLTHKADYTIWTPVAYGYGDLTDDEAWLDDSGDTLPDDPIVERTLIDYIPIVYIEASSVELIREIRTEPKPAFSYTYFGNVVSYSGDTLLVDLYDKDGALYTSGEYYHIDVVVLSTGLTDIEYNVPWIKALMDIQVVQYPGDNKFYFSGGLITSAYRG